MPKASQNILEAAQAKRNTKDAMDRPGGKKDSIVGAVTGDRSQETQAKLWLVAHHPN